MVQLRTKIVVLCLSLFLVVLAVVSDAAVRTINLSIEKNVVYNNGTDSIRFDWSPSYGSMCKSAKFEILNPSGSVIYTQNKSCGTSYEIWKPAECQSPGIYTGRLTITSEWSGDEYCPGITTFTDKAELQFKVCPAAWFTIFKFEDLDGNGVQSAGEKALAGWTFEIKDQGGVVKKTITTNSNGSTDKITLPVGRYCIHEIIPSTGCWESTTTNPVCKDFVACDNGTVKFGNRQTGKFRAYKFNDLDGNRAKDSGEPPLSGWEFTVRDSNGNVIGTKLTDGTGYTDYFVVPIGNYTIEEVLKPLWEKTTNPGVDRVPVPIAACDNKTENFGNWQPIVISTRALVDCAPWPWKCPKWTGPNGQTNPLGWEPQLGTQSPEIGIKGATFELYRDSNPVAIDTQTAGNDGIVTFKTVGWANSGSFTIKQLPITDSCLCNPNDASLCNNCKTVKRVPWPWPGKYISTMAISQWAATHNICSNYWSDNPDILKLSLPTPTKLHDTYDKNWFFDRHPSRIWGMISKDVDPNDVQISLTKTVNGQIEKWPSNVYFCKGCGFYMVEVIPAEMEGIRSGCSNNGCGYTLELKALKNRSQSWKITDYWCCADTPSPTEVNRDYLVNFGVQCGTDVRIDFGVDEAPNDRRCFQPVTFTRQGWAAFGDPANTVIPGGILYTKFGMALNGFKFYGSSTSGNLVIGGNKQGQNTITFINKTSSLDRLRLLLGGDCDGCGKLMQTLESPWKLDPNQGGGCLAAETIALLLNIAYNDQRLMPRWCGVDLECYIIAEGPLKGKRVADALNIANSVLQGEPPCQHGLQSCEQLVFVLQQINANYEFIDFNTYTDRGYLQPHEVIHSTMECQNRHPVKLPIACK